MTTFADRARLSPLFDVCRRIRVLPEEPFFQQVTKSRNKLRRILPQQSLAT